MRTAISRERETPPKRCTRCGQDKPATVADYCRHPRAAPHPETGERVGIYCADCRRALRRERRARRHPRIVVDDVVPPLAPSAPETPPGDVPPGAAPVEVPPLPLADEGRLTAAGSDRLVAMFTAGALIADACRSIGLDVETFMGWMKRGESDDPADAQYAALRARVETARANAQVRAVAIISRAAESDWRAASWYLERSDPEHWGRDRPRRPLGPGPARPRRRLRRGRRARPTARAVGPAVRAGGHSGATRTQIAQAASS